MLEDHAKHRSVVWNIVGDDLSSVNKRILETIEDSKFPEEIKDLLKSLLNVELKNNAEKYPLYSKDYDRIIMNLAEVRKRKKGE